MAYSSSSQEFALPVMQDVQSPEIDEDLHSRQLAVYGRETMHRLAASNILISGMQGLGAEIAKNLILAGVKSVTLHDEGAVELWDLSSSFIFSEEDLGKNRALASVSKLQELNYAVIVSTLSDVLAKEQLSDFQAVVFTDISLKKAIEFDEYCHKHRPPIAFIKSEVRGLFGSVFCDFGPEFMVFDVNGEDPHTVRIASISNDNPALVTCVDDKRLEFQDGDLVVFSEVQGMTELNGGKPRKIKNGRAYSVTIGGEDTTCYSPYERGEVLSIKQFIQALEYQGNPRKLESVRAYSFTIEEDTTYYSRYARGGIITQVKEPKVLNFKPLRQALEDPGDFLPSDFSKFDRPPLLHMAFQALDKFTVKFGCFPLAGSEEDAQKLIAIVIDINKSLSDDRLEEIDQKLLRNFAFGARAVLNPMAAMFGGIVGQEVVKACSGKFHPLFQFFYFDSVESLPSDPLDPSDLKPLDCRYDAQISVFGSKLQEKLEAAKIFIVGSGALGCEFLKNLALMGVCCGDGGKLTITDDDIIEKSNLSRQFLFRDWNIGQAKSTVAASAASLINPNLHVEALQNRAMPKTEIIFDDTFWENLTVVINALDNVAGRHYIDEQCVYFQKPLLESGTLGGKCNTQMVIPHLTENYGALRDAPDDKASMCTVHTFPHNIDHCLIWARSEFDGLLEKIPIEVNAYLTNPSKYISTMKNVGDAQARDTLNRVLECLDRDKCDTFQDCITWARLKFADYFANGIWQLRYTFPKDATTSSGARFWAPPKCFPCPLPFSTSDLSHLHFVMAAAILRAETFGISNPDWVKWSENLADAIDKINVPAFLPCKDVNIFTTDEEATSLSTSSTDDTAHVINRLIKKLEVCRKKLPPGFKINPIKFEKDDDTNYHMDLIASLANLRARNYSIPEVSKLKAKFIAERIISAIATTTAMETGIVGLEVYTVLYSHPEVEDYRNTPMCTSFPHKIDHCLIWARSEFDDLLEKIPTEVNAYLTNPSKYISTMTNAGDAQARDTLDRVIECLDRDRCDTFQDCITWARLKFADYFANRIRQLIYTFPEYATTSRGERFWIPPKRFPRSLLFSTGDLSHLHFVTAAAILRAETFSIPIPDWVKWSENLADAINRVNVPAFLPRKYVKIFTTDEKATSLSTASIDNNAVINELIMKLEVCRKKLPPGFKMNPIQFAKDDDTNYHVGLIAGLANLRARNYSIPEVDRLKAKFIAGRIIPAFATTTAMATGLVCLELYKVLDGHHKVEDYRNTFANLALPLFLMAEPVPPKVIKHRDMSWTVWDRPYLKENATLRDLLKWCQNEGIKAYCICAAYCLIYDSLSPRNEDRLDRKLMDVVKEMTNVELPLHRCFFEVIVCIKDIEDVHIPQITELDLSRISIGNLPTLPRPGKVIRLTISPSALWGPRVVRRSGRAYNPRI